MEAEKVLVLRTCSAEMLSYGGFKWPESGPVECDDWDPTPECGGGLHGLLWGEGNGLLLNWDDAARWLVVEVDADQVIDVDGKVKFPRCDVVHCGDKDSAIGYILANGAEGKAVVGAKITAGYSGQATAGYSGQATAGDSGQATAGDSGQATAGDRGQATAGDRGQATAGYSGQATAGDGGTIIISYWDNDAQRRRLVVGYVGENNIQPGTQYRLNDDHEFVLAKEE